MSEELAEKSDNIRRRGIELKNELTDSSKRRLERTVLNKSTGSTTSIERVEKEIQTNGSLSTLDLSIENMCWLIASIACLYFSDIIRVLFIDARIYRFLMNVSFCLIGVNLVIAFYFVVWLTRFKKIDSNRWNEMHPTLIPIATACFVSGSILLTIAIWPVYTWLSAPLLFTIFMGIIVILINIPSLI